MTYEDAKRAAQVNANAFGYDFGVERNAFGYTYDPEKTERRRLLYVAATQRPERNVP